MLEYGCASSLSPSSNGAEIHAGASAHAHKISRVAEAWNWDESLLLSAMYSSSEVVSFYSGGKIKPPQILNANRNFTFCLLKGQNKLALRKTELMLSTGLCPITKILQQLKVILIN